jgi:hypothetical protein
MVVIIFGSSAGAGDIMRGRFSLRVLLFQKRKD